jgi:hypothetical protein
MATVCGTRIREGGRLLAVDWTAVGAIAGSIAAAVAIAAKLLLPAVRALRDPTRRRKEASAAYETQLKVTAKAIDDARAGRQLMSTAQNELNELSEREERLRQEFGSESTVHWVARINRGMLRRAFDIAVMSAPDPWFDALIKHGVDDAGLRVFEIERDVALRQRQPVLTFVTSGPELERLADLAKLEPPYDERFNKALAGSITTAANRDTQVCQGDCMESPDQ